MSRFVMANAADKAALYPLLPAQSALAFVLEPATWPSFRSWLLANQGGDSTDSDDRADIERAFGVLIEITREVQ